MSSNHNTHLELTEVRAPADSEARNDVLWCLACDSRMCEVEVGDSLNVLCHVASQHAKEYHT